MEVSETKTKVYVHGLKGRIFSPEHKEKIRLAKLGKKLSPAHKEKMSLARLGKKHSPETIEKMRLARLGKKLSPERVQNIRLANFGRKHTPETKEKMRLALLGKPCTSPKSAKGPQHFRSVACEFRSPTNVVWYVKNISHFIRTHPELFNPEDLIIKKYKSRALAGLLSLTARKRPNGSWKGWTLVSKIEKEDNKGKDLLDRVFVEATDEVTYPGT